MEAPEDEDCAYETSDALDSQMYEHPRFLRMVGGWRRQGTYNTANCPRYVLRMDIAIETLYASRHAQVRAVSDICCYTGDEHSQVNHYDQVV